MKNIILLNSTERYSPFGRPFDKLKAGPPPPAFCPASSGTIGGTGLKGRGLGVDATASRLHAVNGVGFLLALALLLPLAAFGQNFTKAWDGGLGGADPDVGALEYIAVLDDGLVAYYPFNGNADDESENANHGTVNGATLAEDRFGNASSAYSFDGTNDWITATDQNGYLGQPFQDFTIAGWIYSNGQQASYVFRAASSDGDLHLGTPDNAHAAITAKIGGVVEKAYYPFLHNTWEYIVGTWDGSRLIFFFNGSPVDTVLTSGSLNPAPTLWGNSIGGNVDGTYSFDGLIDDIRIYNRALSEAEIQALYHEGGWDPGLVAHYPFNGNANDENEYPVSDTEDNRLASWSPDGMKTAYISTRDGNSWREQIWVADFTVNSGVPSLSNDINITNDEYRYGDPRWSPDGTKIVFSRNPYNTWNGTIWFFDADGNNLVQLTDSPPEGGADWSPFLFDPPPAAPAGLSATPGDQRVTLTWSPNSEGDLSHYVVYQSTIQGFTPTSADSVVRVNQPDTTATITSLSNGTTYYFRVVAVDSAGNYSAVSNEVNATPMILAGTKIAFGSQRDGDYDIYVMNPDGSNLTNITNTATNESVPRWSPDGSQIAFTSNRDGNYDIHVMNADGSNPYNLTQNPANEERFAWSPDGTRIAFSTNRDGNYEIYVMNADGSGQTRLTNNAVDDHYLDWSPDGNWIVFSRVTTPELSIGHYQLVIMDTNGENEYPVSDTEDNRLPSWSPDGMKIAYISTRDGNSWRDQIWVADFTVNSGVPSLTNDINITNDEYRYGDPRWSPDGTKIVFSRNPYNTWNGTIWFFDSDGGNRVQLTDSPPEGAPDWSPFLFDPPPAAPTGLTATPGDRQITLAWSPNSEEDLARYRIYRNTSSPASTLIGGVVGSPPDTFITDTGLANGQEYFYRITAVDSKGSESDYSAEVSATPVVLDEEGPAITNIEATTGPNIGNTITVTATVTDASPLQSVTLSYAKGGASSYSQVNMLSLGADTHSRTIPATAVTAAGVACFIAAEDNLGNVSRSDTMSIQVGFPSGTITTSMTGSAFRTGFPKNKWRLISIPGDIADTTVSDIIEAVLESAPSDETWKIFRYTGPDPDDYVAATSFASGESYFLKQVVTDDVHFTLGDGQSADLTGGSLALAPGEWHFVSSPYAFPVEVTASQSIFRGPYTYGAFGSGGQEGWSMEQVQDTFEPWGGYIIYNNTGQTQTLELKPPGLAKALLAKGTSDPIGGWLLHLTAEGTHYFDAGNIIGRIQGASNDRDEFDSPEPPYLDGYISLALDRPEWSPNAGLSRFTSDVRTLDETNGVWDLDLHTRGETGPITITYNIQGEVPPGTQVVLLDLVQRRACDLTAGELPEAVTDYSEELPRRLKVIAGTPDYVQGTIEEALARLPEEFALSQNYPNPFNPSTTIEYALPKPARVSLHIYNLLGREIAVLVNDWQDMGYYEIVWQGRDRAGRSVATGVYFIVLQADGHVLTRKMVLLR